MQRRATLSPRSRYNRGMSRKRRLVRVAVCAAVLIAYVGGYFVWPHGQYAAFGDFYRIFPLEGLNRLYVPLGWLECKIRGRTVTLSGPTPGHGIQFDPGALW
jgi:hypothetical protein